MPFPGPAALFLTTSVAGVNVNVADITADGLTVQQLSCTLDQGGLFASALVVGALAQKKNDLDACAPAGAAVELEWTWSGGKASKANATRSSLSKAAACVETAVRKVPAPASGTCRAIVLVGDPTAAAAAVDQLRPVKP